MTQIMSQSILGTRTKKLFFAKRGVTRLQCWHLEADVGHHSEFKVSLGYREGTLPQKQTSLFFAQS